MERIKQILTDNVSYTTVAELNDLLERKDNLNPQESFMLGVNVGRTVEHVVNNDYYTSDEVSMLNDFIEGNMQKKPAVIKKDLKDTVREYITELNVRSKNINTSSNYFIVKGVGRIDIAILNIVNELEELLRDFENPAEVKNALNQTEKETITENHRLTKYP